MGDEPDSALVIETDDCAKLKDYGGFEVLR
jgi:hypothetical protein